jgi:hypothetical protein
MFVVGRLAARVQPKYLIVAGAVIIAISMYQMTDRTAGANPGVIPCLHGRFLGADADLAFRRAARADPAQGQARRSRPCRPLIIVAWRLGRAEGAAHVSNGSNATDPFGAGAGQCPLFPR